MTTRHHRLHRLSALEVKNLKSAGWHADGGGLFLEIDPSDGEGVGSKRWAMRLTVNGKRRDFGLGPLHKVSLQFAREVAAEYRAKAYRGIDPVADKKSVPAPPKPTFEKAANEVHRLRKTTWRNGKHVNQWINTLRDYAFPTVGAKPVDQVGAPELLAILAPIWTTKPETARRVRQRIGVVLDWARAAGFRSGDNPMPIVDEALPKQKKNDRHHAALPYEHVCDFIVELRDGTSAPITKLAFEFLILTAARSNEVRSALWTEIDTNEKLWTVPGDDAETGRGMKSGRDHIVPLSLRCIEILEEARKLSTSDLIFPDSDTGAVLSENRFLNSRDALGYTNDQCTPHGFRSSFRDWAAEETSFPSEVVEMALAHRIKSKVEAAYRRGQLLAKRRELMNEWTIYAIVKHPNQ